MSGDLVEPTKRMTRRQAGKLLCLFPFFPSIASYAQSPSQKVHSELDFESSDPQLNSAFRWAKSEALSYAFENDPVGPWYEASLPGRHAFCMRDTSHQANGAQALGLSRFNHNMLRRFAKNISASRDWCSYWEIDREDRPAPVDYKSDAQFWYNLPANYDVLDACYRMFLWSGEKSYVEDPVFLNFYDRTIIDYTERWDLSPEHIMQRTSKIQEPPFFRGDPTYEESSRNNVLGIDLLAAQYAAFRAYSAIQTIRGDLGSARRALDTAAQIKRLINSVWWNASEGYFYAFLDKEHRFLGRAGSDLLYWDAADDGPKVTSALDTLLHTMKTEPEDAVEPKSHYAEILYRYGRPEEAYEQIANLTQDGRKRREYPEVSYSVIGAIVSGLFGVQVRPLVPPAKTASGTPIQPVIETSPQLTTKIGWAALRNLPIQQSKIDVRHDGNGSTIVTNSGKSILTWKARFPGSFTELRIDGKAVKAQSEMTLLDRPTTWLETPLPPGKTFRVQIPNV